MHGFALVIYIYIYIYILDWTCRYTSAGMFISSSVQQQKRGTAVTVTIQLQFHLGVTLLSGQKASWPQGVCCKMICRRLITFSRVDHLKPLRKIIHRYMRVMWSSLEKQRDLTYFLPYSFSSRLLPPPPLVFRFFCLAVLAKKGV